MYGYIGLISFHSMALAFHIRTKSIYSQYTNHFGMCSIITIHDGWNGIERAPFSIYTIMHHSSTRSLTHALTHKSITYQNTSATTTWIYHGNQCDANVYIGLYYCDIFCYTSMTDSFQSDQQISASGLFCKTEILFDIIWLLRSYTRNISWWKFPKTDTIVEKELNLVLYISDDQGNFSVQ